MEEAFNSLHLIIFNFINSAGDTFYPKQFTGNSDPSQGWGPAGSG